MPRICPLLAGTIGCPQCNRSNAISVGVVFAGSKTTFRLLSKEAVKAYLEDIDGDLALQGNETVIAMPSDYTDYFQ
eukprot:7788680-Pyramimonas_sp.AAC.2